MFCPFCGKENDDNVKFCGGCGADISKHGKGKSASHTPKPAEAPAPKPPKPEKKKDYAAVKKKSLKAVVLSSVSLVLSVILSVGSAAWYIVAPDAALDDKAMDPPAQAEAADPVYDLDFLAKPKIQNISFGGAATEKQLAELKKDIEKIETVIEQGEEEAFKQLEEIYAPEDPVEDPVDPPVEAPTEDPTEEPTDTPTEAPTDAPSEDPTEPPTEKPTEAPTEDPTEEPDEPLKSPYENTPEAQTMCLDIVGEKVRDLYYEGAIADYEISDEAVAVELHSGIYYFYIPEVEGADAGTDGTLKIATYQPCLSGYSSAYSRFMQYPDSAAERIQAVLAMYSFDGDIQDYNDGEVDGNTLFTMPEYSVILWHGHGGYSGDLGPMMTTGIPITDENTQALYSLLLDGSLALSNSNYLVMSVFFENHVEDGAFDNTIVYLGTCSSGRSDRMAQALLAKGAEAVYANSGVIHTTYNLSMMDSVVEGLCTTHDNGTYYNVREALDYAYNENGEYDTGDYSYTRVNLYTNNESFTLDWYEDHMVAEREVVMVLDVSGSMEGTPLDETKKAASAFITSTLDAKATISIVEFASSAKVLTGFTRRENVLQGAIDALGTYGSTNTYDGLYTARELLSESKAKKKIVVLMSDGIPNEGLVGDDLAAFADEMRADGIYLYTLGFFHNLGDYDKSAAQDILRRIADEGNYHDVADAENITYVFDDIANEISGERRIYIRVACPVDVEVTYDGETLSKKNPRTSFGSLAFELPEDAENMGEDADDDDTIKIVRLKEGLDYGINIEGTGSGSMDYTIGFMDENGEYNDFREFKNVKIKRSTVIKTKATYSDTTTMLVDEDGDGSNDYIYTAKKDGKAEKKEVGTDWRIIVAIIFGVIAALALVSLVVSVKIFKYSKSKLAELAPVIA